MSRDSTAPKAFGKGGAQRRQVRGRERGTLAPFFKKIPPPRPPSMPFYRSPALAVAVAGDALNGGVPTQLVHLILGEFQFVEIVVALERTELIAQFDDLLGNLKGNRAGPGQLLGGGAVQLKTFFHFLPVRIGAERIGRHNRAKRKGEQGRAHKGHKLFHDETPKDYESMQDAC